MLGRSDLKISRIGFGGMSLEHQNPMAENILLQALDGGINYFDTADIYHQGLNETLIGKTFIGKRDQIVLATKVGNRLRADGTGLDWVPSKKYILSAIEQSLERLHTDYIDLYQLHGGTLQDPIDEIIEAFELLKSSGKIRFYGISSIRPNVIREYVKRSSIISVMMQYSLLDRRPEEEMLSFLFENKIGVLARGSIAKGLLVSKKAEIYLDYSAEQVKIVTEAVQSVSDAHHSTLNRSVQYVLDHPAVSTAVIGIRTMEQLKDVLAIDQEPPPGKDLMKILSSALPSNQYTEHR